MNKYKQPDGLRGMLTLFVIASHWLSHGQHFNSLQLFGLSVISQIGEIGMYFFFVLSGFLISGILIRNRLKAEKERYSKKLVWKNYFIRRTLRIFPVYYLTITILYVFNISGFRPYAFWHFGYLTNVFFYLHQHWELGGHLWSLSTEEQFYLLWPFLIFFIPIRHLKKVIVSLIFIAPFFRMGMNLYRPSEFTMYLTPAVLDGLGLGALLALIKNVPSESVNEEHKNRGVKLMAAVAMSLIILFHIKPFQLNIWEQFNPFFEIFNRSSMAVVGLFLVNGSINGFKGFWKHLLENKVAQYLGKISYALYLFHNFQLYAFEWLHINLPATGWYLGVHFLILVTLASLSWYLLELPINNLKKYFPYIKYSEKQLQPLDIQLQNKNIG